MFVSKASVIFFSLLILNVTLKSTQAMPMDVEPREYDEYNGLDDYSFMKNEVDGLKEELGDEYGETNDGEDALDERVEEIEDGTEDGDSDVLIEEELGKGDELYELEGENDYGAVVGEDEEGEDEELIEKNFGEIPGEDEEGEGEAQVEEGFGEVLGEDEEGEDQVGEDSIVEIVEEMLGDDQVEDGLDEIVGDDEEGEDQVEEGFGEDEEGDNDEYQGNVYHKGAQDDDNDDVDSDDGEPRRFPHTWLNKVKEYFKKARYYLGV